MNNSMLQKKQCGRGLTPQVIVVIYAVVGLLWILISDLIVDMISKNSEVINRLQTYKGSFYIIVTAVVLYWLVRRYGDECMLAVAALKESEEKYRLLFHNTPIGIFNYDSQLRITDCNDSFIDILQSSREKLVGLDMKTLKDQSVLPAIRKAIDGDEGFYQGSYRATTSLADIWVSMRTAPVFDRAGKITSGVGIVENITKRKKTEDELAEQALDAALAAEVGEALIQSKDLRSLLELCTESIVKHLDAAFARIWTLNEKDNVLELQASAGMYTHINGAHGRVPVGKFKIGLIAEEKKPHLTNNVLGDPRIGDPEWARREGMVAFAGHPLIVADKLVGVMAMFSKKPLKETTLTALASIANEIALGIERTRAEESVEEERRFSENLIENSAVATFVLDQQHKVVFWNKACEELTGVPVYDMIGTGNQWKPFYGHKRPLLADIVIDADFEILSHLYTSYSESTLLPNALHAEGWYRNLNGKDRYILFDAAPIHDIAGTLIAAVETLQDITERKKAEEEIKERVEELEKFYEMAVGRELKMKELKKDIAELKEEISRYRKES